MSSKYDRKTNTTTFDCDQPGCHVNYETKAGDFRSGWKAAQSEGWAYVPKTVKGIDEPKHYCPTHAEQFDRPRGG